MDERGTQTNAAKVTTKTQQLVDPGGVLGHRRGVTGSAEIHNIILTWREDGLTAVNSETSKSYRKRRGVSFAVRVAQGAARKTKARTIKKNKQIRQGRKAAHQQAGHMFTNTV